MTRVIDAPEAIELLERAVQAKGEGYIDPNAAAKVSCEYGDEQGNPLCIVGHVFSYLGINPDTVYSAGVRSTIQSGGVRSHYYRILEGSPTFTDLAQRALAVAQDEQDNAHTWSYALAKAKRLVEVSA